MKKLFILALALSFFSFLSSCDDDDSSPVGNNLEINGETFAWNDYGEFWTYNSEDMYSLNAFTGSLRIDPSNYNKMKGSGDWLEVEFYSDASPMNVGKYDIEEEGNIYCTISLHYDVTTTDGYPSYQESVNFISGTIEVTSPSSKVYTLKINAVAENGDVLKGQFTASYSTMNAY